MEYILYLVQISIYTAIMWCIYVLVLRNRVSHAYSRLFLLMSLILPVVLPFIHLPVRHNAVASAYSVLLPQVNASGVLSYDTGLSWLPIVGYGYGIISILLAVLYVRAHFVINKKIRQGSIAYYNDTPVVIETGIGPGTLNHKIFFPNRQINDLVVRHELAHINAGHRYDSLLIQICHIALWASPMHWLIGRELKMVHEFQADEMVTNDVDAADYASLLLSQSFGTGQSFLIAHSFFHHPLKRRIMMLQNNKKPRTVLLLLTSIVLTIAFTSTVLFAQKKGAAKSTELSEREKDILMMNYGPSKNGQISLQPGAIVFNVVDQMPEFNGEFRDWMVGNLHFPEGALSEGRREGKSIVQFTVSADGKIMDPKIAKTSGSQILDEEALRVVKAMPNWKPGKQKGKPVAVSFTLPIMFSLDGKVYAEGC